jgi:imidazolonepropionase-like amidohydrolase
MTMRPTRSTVLLASLFAFLALPLLADAPHIYAITGARIFTAAGSPIPTGTVVIRNGLIERADASGAVPADAQVIDGRGLAVYPGLVDMNNLSIATVPENPAPRDPTTREEVERWKRSVILRPHLFMATGVKVDAPELSRLASAGITTALAAPPGDVIKGQSALINVVAPDDTPQIGDIVEDRRGLVILKTPVALHVSFSTRAPGAAYPQSVMGVLAFIRQAFLDGQHYQREHARYGRMPRGVERPAHNEALAAMQPVLMRQVPVIFEANLDRDIRRALDIAKAFSLDPIIEGAHEAGALAAELKASGARVIVNLNYPERPRTLAPDADEPIRDLRRRANAPKVPAMLDQAGVQFAFGSGGLRTPRDFVRNAAKAVKAGLSVEAAIRALTINAATLAGVGDRLGSIEKGKFANLVVTDGDLFEEKTTIKHVFVDGRLVRIEPEPPAETARP